MTSANLTLTSFCEDMREKLRESVSAAANQVIFFFLIAVPLEICNFIFPLKGMS